MILIGINTGALIQYDGCSNIFYKLKFDLNILFIKNIKEMERGFHLYSGLTFIT